MREDCHAWTLEGKEVHENPEPDQAGVSQSDARDQPSGFQPRLTIPLGLRLAGHTPIEFSGSNFDHIDGIPASRAFGLTVNTKTRFVIEFSKWLTSFLGCYGNDTAVFQPDSHHSNDAPPKPLKRFA